MGKTESSHKGKTGKSGNGENRKFEFSVKVGIVIAG